MPEFATEGFDTSAYDNLDYENAPKYRVEPVENSDNIRIITEDGSYLKNTSGSIVVIPATTDPTAIDNIVSKILEDRKSKEANN